MTGSKETLITEPEAKDALREALEGRSALIAVDDVWTIDHADTLSVTASPTRSIFGHVPRPYEGRRGRAEPSSPRRIALNAARS
jgi:hypothetical protein